MKKTREREKEKAVDEQTLYIEQMGGKVTDGLVRIREIWVHF